MSANRNSFVVAALARGDFNRAFPAFAKDAEALSKESIQAALDSAYAQFKDLKEGKNADYIPALAKVDPNIYGIALVTTDGQVYTKGDIASEVSIQSISKVFTMAWSWRSRAGRDREQHGRGRHRAGLQLDQRGRAVQGRRDERHGEPGRHHGDQHGLGRSSRDEIWNKILGYYSDFAGRPLSVNQEVFKSEADTNQRNQAIAMLMYAYGHIKDNPDQATDIYTEQCSGQRQRQGPRHDGGHPGERRQEPGDRQGRSCGRRTCRRCWP